MRSVVFQSDLHETITCLDYGFETRTSTRSRFSNLVTYRQKSWFTVCYIQCFHQHWRHKSPSDSIEALSWDNSHNILLSYLLQTITWSYGDIIHMWRNFQPCLFKTITYFSYGVMVISLTYGVFSNFVFLKLSPISVGELWWYSHRAYIKILSSSKCHVSIIDLS